MRKLKIPILIILSLTLLMLSTALAMELRPEDEGFTLMAENENRALLLNEETLNIRLVNLLTGENWDSCVPKGSKGNKTVKNTQKSTFTLAFISDPKRATITTMDSYSKSVSLGNYSILPIENGFEVSYEVGDDTLIIDDLPKGIRVDKYFNLRDNAGWSSKEKKDFEAQYRALKPAGLDQEYMIRVKDDSLSILQIKQIYGLLFDSGLYTIADMEEDNEAVGYERTYLPRHTIKTRYQLMGDDFVVTLPAGEIESSEGNDITYIDLMPYFMTASDAYDGFMLVPDGSGGVIRLNNQKLAATSYTGKVYGPDVLINSSTYSMPRDEIGLPVMGINKNGSGVLAIIEKGAELATLGAEISGRSDEFNRMSVRFTLREVENVALTGNDSITTPRYASDVYQGDIIIRYRLLDKGNADVAGMANAYRQYLIDSGILTPRVPSEHAPFFAELIGAVAKDKFFLGIPYQSSVQATNFSEAQEIYKSLKEKGLENVHLIYSGLFYGGVKHAALTDPTLDSGLGKEKQLKELIKNVKDNGDFFYPGVYFGRVYSDRDFSTLGDAARRHDGEPATVSVFGEPVMKLARQNIKGYYISPYYLPEYTEEVKEELNEYGFSGLNIFDFGNTLTPDYKRKQHLSRIHAASVYQDTLASLSEEYRLLLDKPMLYALPYADAAVMLPERDNGFKLIDEAVPFLQYVLSGCMDISGSSWNLKSHLGIEKELLWALECLESPRFTFTAQSPTIFQNTNDMDYMSYFSTVYTDWADKAVEMYNQYDAFYQMVSNARVSKHEVLSDTLRKVSYDNGISVLLNYGQTEAEIEGNAIPALGYLIQEEVQP